MRKTILVFGCLILALLLLFRFSHYALVSSNLKIEIIIAIIAIVFFFIGVYLNKKSLHQNPIISSEIDHKKVVEFEITKREYEVLQLISKGLSNKEIANQLYVSESTIKTHVSSLLVKLDAKRRTQAIQIAKELHIL